MTIFAQCGAVRPFWVEAGWVLWHGSPAREKKYCIVYRRCVLPPQPPVELGGFEYHLCKEHLEEVVERYARVAAYDR